MRVEGPVRCHHPSFSQVARILFSLQLLVYKINDFISLTELHFMQQF